MMMWREEGTDYLTLHWLLLFTSLRLDFIDSLYVCFDRFSEDNRQTLLFILIQWITSQVNPLLSNAEDVGRREIITKLCVSSI